MVSAFESEEELKILGINPDFTFTGLAKIVRGLIPCFIPGLAVP
jgi:hypothetical protein